MTFKRNITVRIACCFTEILISLMFAILIMVMILRPEELGVGLFTALIIYPPVILVVNVFLLLISWIACLFLRTTYSVKDGYITVTSKQNVIRISYAKVASMEYDLGTVQKHHSDPSELVLYDNRNRVLLSVTEPSLIMVHLIRKKCHIRRMRYRNGKRFLWTFLIANGAALVISVLSQIFV